MLREPARGFGGSLRVPVFFAHEGAELGEAPLRAQEARASAARLDLQDRAWTGEPHVGSLRRHGGPCAWWQAELALESSARSEAPQELAHDDPRSFLARDASHVVDLLAHEDFEHRL